MTEKEMKEIEDFYTDSCAMVTISEDKAKKHYFQGEAMGMYVLLYMLGYTVKEDGVRVKYLPNIAKSIECKHYKVVKRPSYED